MSEEIVVRDRRRGRTPVRIARSGARPALMTAPFVILLLCQAGFGFAFSSFFLLPKFLSTQLGASPSQIGSLTSVTSLATVFFMIWTGSIADRFGRRPLLTAGSLLMAVSSVAFVSIETMGPGVYVLRLLQALAFSMVYVSGASMTVEMAPSERLGEALGYFGLTGLSMNAVAPAIVERCAEGPGWHWAFAVAAGGALTCAALSRGVTETWRRNAEAPPLPSIARILCRPEQRLGAGVMALVGASFATMFVYHQLFALELGIPEVRSFFVSYAIAAMAARIGLGSLGDRWGRRRTSIGSLALYSASVFAMLALAQVGLAPIGAAFGLAHGIFYPTFSAWMVERTDPILRSRTVALLQAWFNVGVAASAFGFGALAEHAGYVPVFAAAGACAAAALLLTAGGRDPIRRGESGSPAQRKRRGHPTD